MRLLVSARRLRSLRHCSERFLLRCWKASASLRAAVKCSADSASSREASVAALSAVCASVRAAAAATSSSRRSASASASSECSSASRTTRRPSHSCSAPSARCSRSTRSENFWQRKLTLESAPGTVPRWRPAMSLPTSRLSNMAGLALPCPSPSPAVQVEGPPAARWPLGPGAATARPGTPPAARGVVAGGAAGLRAAGPKCRGTGCAGPAAGKHGIRGCPAATVRRRLTGVGRACTAARAPAAACL
mmetsp:Transcript_15598/g.49069  ORF Transcript_15598/g.49069 Transcript_15598/m.49069 type:complete len:247 (+) Transcript_15598:46-786(+)